MTQRRESRKTKRNQAAKARAREEHVRLLIARQDDPAYVQQARTPTGRDLYLNPDAAATVRAAMESQRAAFKAKFGREPGPSDPIFFDPTLDEPTVMTGETFVERTLSDEAFLEMRGLAEPAERAIIDAWLEVGYIITEDTQHLFTALEVEEFLNAVERAQQGEEGS